MAPLLDADAVLSPSPDPEEQAKTPKAPEAHEPKAPPLPFRGTMVDTVADISPPLSQTTELPALVKLLTLAYRARSPAPSKEAPLNALMRTLSSDRLGKVTTASFPRGFTRDEVLYSFCRFLSPVLNGLTGLVEFEESVAAGEDPEAFRSFWTLDGRNLLAEATTELSMSPESSISADAAAMGPDVKFLDTFVEGGDKESKRVALTKERGLLALVPASVGVGDEVWTVSRLSLPFFLGRRDQGEGGSKGASMVIVGEGYVHGLCESETASGSKERYKDVDLPLSSVAVGLAGGIPG